MAMPGDFDQMVGNTPNNIINFNTNLINSKAFGEGPLKQE
jgi:hypothetical protein